jgi:hypothetical protein
MVPSTCALSTLASAGAQRTTRLRTISSMR